MFETSAGDVHVSTRDDGGRIAAGLHERRADGPRLRRPRAAAGAARLDVDDLDPRMPLAEAFAGNWHPVVAVRTIERFDAFEYDAAALRVLMDARGWTGTVTVVHVAVTSPTAR